jgi:hypothetical protein
MRLLLLSLYAAARVHALGYIITPPLKTCGDIADDEAALRSWVYESATCDQLVDANFQDDTLGCVPDSTADTYPLVATYFCMASYRTPASEGG